MVPKIYFGFKQLPAYAFIVRTVVRKGSWLKMLALILLIGWGTSGFGQIDIPNTTAVVENFDAMGTNTTDALPASWRFHNSSSPSFSSGTRTLGQQASSGAPTGGSGYNWGSSATERAPGVMSSGSFASPSSIIGFFRNTNAGNLTSLSITYDVERYRRNTSAASVQFFYSTNGSTWTALTAGDVAAASLPTGTSVYGFNPPNLVVNVSAFALTFPTPIVNNGTFYLRWNLNTTGSNSQGIGIDNVSLTATFASAATPSIAISRIDPGASNVAQGTTNVILQQYNLAVTDAAASLTGLTVNTEGTYLAADITNLKVRYSTDATLDVGDATLSTLSIVSKAGSQVFPSFTAQSVTIGTRYIFITADIAATAGLGRNINIGNNAFANFTFASGTKTGTDPVDAAGVKTFVAPTPPTISLSSPSQTGASNIDPSTTNNILSHFQAAITTANATLNSVAFTTTGSYLASDLTGNFRLFFSTSATFVSASSIGSVAVGAAGTFNFTGISQSITSGNTGYFWIVADASASSGGNRTLTVSDNPTLTFASGSPTGTITAGGTKTFPLVTVGWAISTTNTRFIIDFDNTVSGVNNGQFAGTGFQPTPTVGQLDSDAWAVTGLSDGTLAFGGTRTTGDFSNGISIGGVTSGGIYGFTIASTLAVNRALGIQPTGTDWTPGTITLRLQNSTGTTINSYLISYVVYERNDGPRSNSFNFSYSSDNSTYTGVSVLDFTSGAAADVSPFWKKHIRNTLITSLSVADGDFFYLRWSGDDVGGSGDRDEFGLDDIVAIANYTNVYPEYTGTTETLVMNGIANLSGNTSVTSTFNLASGGRLEIGANTLTLNGAISGTGNLSGSTSSNLSISGSGTLNFTTGGTNNFLKDLSLSGAADVTLGNALNISGGATPGTVTVSGTAQLNTVGNLTLKSDASGTARVAQVTSSATTPISGEVTVERFIPQAPVSAGPPVRNGRAWRLLSIPVTGSSTIWQAWGNGAASRVNSLGVGDVPNPAQTPGIGTLITGHAYPSAATANAAFYDWWPALFVGPQQAAATSIRRFTPARNNGDGDWLSNTASRNTAATILTFADPAYMLFVRGDRTVAVGSGSTTLAPKGNLRVGAVPMNVPVESTTARFFTYGNPYASTLDFGAVYLSNVGLLKSIMHVWDANLFGTNGLGGYRSVSWNGSAWVDNIDPSATNMQYIQSGQGVLLESDIDDAGYTMFTLESHKVSGNRQISPFAAVTPVSRPMLYSRLYLGDNSGQTNILDGAVAGFNASYSVANDDAFDHSKPLSITGNLALGYAKGGKLLSFEGRPLIQDGDVLYLQTNGLTATAYTLEFEAKDLAAPGRKGYVKDKYLGTETEIPLDGQLFRYGFAGVANVAASMATNRFEVVFKVTTASGWITLSGRAQRPNILLNWTVPSADMFRTYIIQQSGNNVNYKRSAIITADPAAGTELSHAIQPGGGVKFFRVLGITHSGDTIISNEVLIGMNSGVAEVTVTPNPVKSPGGVTLAISKLARANYTVSLLNAKGVPLASIVIAHNGNDQVYPFQIPANLPQGVYYLQIRGLGGNIVRQIVVQ